MASLFEQTSRSSLRYDRRQLGDSLVGPVVDRRHGSITLTHQTHQNKSEGWSSHQTIDRSPLSKHSTERRHTEQDSYRVLPLRNSTNGVNETTKSMGLPPANPISPKQEVAKTFASRRKITKTNYKTPAHRLEQCRINQTRYRTKQKEFQRQLEKSVQSLRRDLDDLKRRRQEVASREMNEQSPWNVVADVFRLLETSFRSPWCMTNKEDAENRTRMKSVLAGIQNAFAHDVSMGNVSGVDALLEQLQDYSRFFGEPQIRLKKVEEEAPGVVVATARLRLTVSEYTLRRVFPYLQKVSRSKYDTLPSVGERLLGQQLHCSCTMRFFFGAGTGRVVKMDTSIDWITLLLQTLGNVEGVLQVLDSALITSECVISASTGNEASKHDR